MATDTPVPATSGTQAAAAKPAKEVQTVKMADGRTVDFPGKRRLQKEAKVDGGVVSVRLDFVNGETFTCALPKAPDGVDPIVLRAAAHGLSQKLGDEISGVQDIDDATTAVDDLIGRIAKGEWNEASTGGEGLAGASVLMKALIELSGKTREEVKAYLGNLNPKQKAALRESDKVKPIVTRLEQEKAKNAKKKDEPAVDTGALLGSLMGGAAAPANSVFAQAPAAPGASTPTPAPATPRETPDGANKQPVKTANDTATPSAPAKGTPAAKK